MSSLTTNLRKAAILMRSVDAETAATLLAQLSPAEAKAVRTAIQELGTIDHDDRSDVATEFRRAGPLFAEELQSGVELDISPAAVPDESETAETQSADRPFKFLEMADVESLVPYLAREQGQTVAVVLSYLKPGRAAALLAALPSKLQTETIKRLSKLRETDPASLQVIEQELADWVERQQTTRARPAGRPDAVAAILAAADSSVRQSILTNLWKDNRELAEQLAPTPPPPITTTRDPSPAIREPALARGSIDPSTAPDERAIYSERVSRPPAAPPPAPRKLLPQMRFDDLAGLAPATLAELLPAVDPDVWVLALAGASDTVVNRIAGQMPRKLATAFRRRLHQLGPTRLSDVTAAQREVLTVAARMTHSGITHNTKSPAMSR